MCKVCDQIQLVKGSYQLSPLTYQLGCSDNGNQTSAVKERLSYLDMADIVYSFINDAMSEWTLLLATSTGSGLMFRIPAA